MFHCQASVVIAFVCWCVCCSPVYCWNVLLVFSVLVLVFTVFVIWLHSSSVKSALMSASTKSLLAYNGCSRYAWVHMGLRWANPWEPESAWPDRGLSGPTCGWAQYHVPPQGICLGTCLPPSLSHFRRHSTFLPNWGQCSASLLYPDIPLPLCLHNWCISVVPKSLHFAYPLCNLLNLNTVNRLTLDKAWHKGTSIVSSPTTTGAWAICTVGLNISCFG